MNPKPCTHQHAAPPSCTDQRCGYWEDPATSLDADPEPSLDTLETSGSGDDWLQPSPGSNPPPLSHTFRHSGWHTNRRKVFAALQATNQPASRLSAFAYCGCTCYILRSKINPDQVRVAASSCHDRFCLPCGKDRSRTIAANVIPYVLKQNCRFITLTLRQRTKPLFTEIDRLYYCFAQLRRTPLWKKAVWGGAAFLEVKRSKDGLRWHPHVHCLVQGKYMAVAHLANAWKAITTDSHIVDIRMVYSVESAVAYVCKYASKPLDPTIFNNEATLQEAILALHGRRLCLCFGKWKGLQMTEKPAEEKWEIVDTLDNLAIQASHGDIEAERLLHLAIPRQADRIIELARARYPRGPCPIVLVPDLSQTWLTFPDQE